MSNSVADIYKETREIFSAAGIATPALDARLLLSAVLGITHEQWVAQRDAAVTAAQTRKMEDFRRRRLTGEPVSRILGRRGFYGGEFLLSAATLDPRPDTETLVETVIKELGPRREEALRILDLGTGTGCIALTLLTLCPKAAATAVDVAEEAVATAAENARRMGLADRCRMQVLDWTAAEDMRNFSRREEKFDVVVSNPPYIPTAEIEKLDRDVRLFDPSRALDGGADGLDCYRDILALLPELLAEDGLCVLEIGHDQAEDVRRLCEENGFSGIGCAKDLAGRDRCIFFHAANKTEKQQETA